MREMKKNVVQFLLISAHNQFCSYIILATKICFTVYFYLPMWKSHLTNYLSIVMVLGGPVVYKDLGYPFF